MSRRGLYICICVCVYIYILYIYICIYIYIYIYIYTGFPKDAENMGTAALLPLRGGGLFKIWWGCLCQYMWEAWWGLKTVVKNTCEGVHLLVKLPPPSLKACKFPKNELKFFNDFR